MPKSRSPVGIRSRRTGRPIHSAERGGEVAEGRYLAFLDYDDVVYPHAYQVSISRLNESGKAVALGGCLIAHLKFVALINPI